ncbi:MAG: hypothetical protein IBX61_03065 [Thermoleophilia bacterium]|nr:hypothetical protein [Thermoleophilia bacterium]
MEKPAEITPEAGRRIDESIVAALCYADIFRFALTLEEIVRFVPGVRITIDEAAARLRSSEELRTVVKQKGNLYYLDGRDDNCQRRLDREAESRRQLDIALRRIIPLQGVPFLRAAAITGALAALNSPAGDDIDLLIISARRRIWSTFFFLRLWRRFGQNPDICFNVFLTEGDLVFSNRNMFYAREILGALPVYNAPAFERFRAANCWIYDVFPSYLPDIELQDCRLPASPRWRRQQRTVEKMLAGPVGDLLEMAVRKLQSRKLASVSPGASLTMRRNRIKLHKQDNRFPILDKYNQRVQDWTARYREAACDRPVRPA